MNPDILTQPNLQQQPINEIPQSKSKFKLILLIIILLILVGGVAYYFGTKQNALLSQNQQKVITPTPSPAEASAKVSDPTANWKTYTSNNYGFEIKYPSDWNHESGVMSEVFVKSFVKNSDDFSCSLDINAWDTVSFDSFMAKDRATQKQNSINVKTSKINNENNISIIKDESPDSIKAQGIYASYYIKNEKGKFSYQVYADISKNIINKDGDHVAYGTVNDQNCLNIFDEMLLAFNFTN